MKAHKWILVKHFQGLPKDSDLEMIAVDLPEVEEGGVLFKALFLSVDPYMRSVYKPLTWDVNAINFGCKPYYLSQAILPAHLLTCHLQKMVQSKHVQIGSVMVGHLLARVLQSRNTMYPEGELFLVTAGWWDTIVINPECDGGDINGPLPNVFPACTNTSDLPASNLLGVIGMPGMSAYYGLLRICQPKSGETVFVNSAAGIVGSIAGQIAKIKGCRVIGCAGTDEKCRWLTSELGFDYAFNYKSRDLSEALKEGAPQGIDCYFDNVGGDMSSTVILKHMNHKGRICACGAISQYNDIDLSTGPHLFHQFFIKELKMEGFLFPTLIPEIDVMSKELITWLQQGKIKNREHIVDGFENARTAFYGMLSGNYTGKVLVRVV